MPYHGSKGVRVVNVSVKKEPKEPKKRGWFLTNARRAGQKEQIAGNTPKPDVDSKVRTRMFKATEI